MIPIGKDATGIGRGFIGAIEDAGHAHFQCSAGGAWQVIDHHTLARVRFIGEFLRNGKRFGHGLAIWRDGVHVNDGVKEIIELQRSEDASGVVHVCVGKDQLPTGQ